MSACDRCGCDTTALCEPCQVEIANAKHAHPSSEPYPMRPRVSVIDTTLIDERLPAGELLIEEYPDGQVHVAFRPETHHSWPVGAWTIER